MLVRNSVQKKAEDNTPPPTAEPRQPSKKDTQKNPAR
jgi:hypothetical protein